MDWNNLKNKASYVAKKAIATSKDVASKAFEVTKDLTIKGANEVKKIANNTYDTIKEKKEEKELAERLRKEQVLNKCMDRFNRVLNSQEGEIKDFLNSLDKSLIYIEDKDYDKIMHKFPVPKEQIIIWAEIDMYIRASGTVVTDKGVFIKSDVSAIDEVTKKEKSNLIYVPWRNFDSELFNNYSFKYEYGIKEYSNFNTAIRSISLSGVYQGMNNNANLIINNSYCNNPSGFGFLVEDYSAKLDKFRYHDSKVIGNDFAKNGPDRIAGGRLIQTKYYSNPNATLNAAFENGRFKYIDNYGNFMKYEVPKDQYQQIKRLFKQKVRNGEIYNIRNEKDVDNILIKGKLTYRQGVNLAKPGTISSIKYDILDGCVSCYSAVPLTFISATAFAYYETRDLNKASFIGMKAAAQTFGLSVLSYVVTNQLLRTSGINYVANRVANQVAFASTLTTGISILAFSIPDTIRYVSKRISGSQYLKNLITLAASIGGGAVGGAIAAKVGAGAVATAATGTIVAVGLGYGAYKIASILTEDDAVRYSRLLNAYITNYCIDYSLSSNEVDEIVSKLSDITPYRYKKLFEDINQAKSDEIEIDNFLRPLFEEVINNRTKIYLNDVDIANLILS